MVVLDNQCENEIWNGLKQFLPVWNAWKDKLEVASCFQFCQLKTYRGSVIEIPQEFQLG